MHGCQYTQGALGSSRQQLAGNVWLVSLGVFHKSRIVGTIYTKSSVGLMGNPILSKNGRVSLYTCADAVDLPHVSKYAFGNQIQAPQGPSL